MNPSPLQRLSFRLSWWARGIAAVLLMEGCGLPPLRVIRYSDHNLIIANPEIVDAFCSDTEGKWDDGTTREKGAPVGGCYSPLPTAWLKDPPNVGTIMHELRHHDCDTNSTNPECGKDPMGEGYK